MTEKTEQKTDYRALMLDALRKIDALEGKLKNAQNQHKEAIAIVGMGCCFPGAEAGLSAYLDLLREGRDAITPMPAWRWQVDDYFDSNPEQPGKMYVREGGFIEHLDRFDAGFFGISPREAMAMDPQQRLWLEVCWEALEQANIVPGDLFSSQTGVFVGASSFDFAAIMAKKLPIDRIDAYLGTGASLNILAGRLSYWLGLTGPSMAVDTACSSSLLAVHNACQSLRLGECDMALAGGVNVILAPETYVAFSRAGMLSAEARCKTFAENADGFIRSEGCGAIVLKRLSDAEKHGDSIWAVIRGSAVNQDGASGGLTIPSGPSQQALINTALAAAGVKPEQVGYIETHGTGTPLGDPIEMRALAASYGKNRDQEPVYVASVKTNLGHLEAAAGIAGLIKAALSLHEAEIFPHLHFTQPSSHIDWQSWPVKIPLERQHWPDSGKPRIAAVSSFGLSGTNVHLIVEQAPETGLKPLKQPGLNLLILSTKTYPALQQLAADYAPLFSQKQANLADICYTANSRRSRFNHRLVLIADSADEFKTQLERFAESGAASGAYRLVTKPKQRVGLLFTGQGSQWAGMAAQMYGYYPEFTEQVDQCDRLLQQFSSIDLKRLLLDNSAEEISETANAQPALFAFEYAWAKQWLAWGVKPACLIGHSLGEYVAACIAGVFDLEQGLRLVVNRARLMQQAPGQGGMAAVFASARKVQAMLPDFPALAIAAYNSAENQVVSGEESELIKFLQSCTEQGLEHTRLATSHGFHSSCMQPVLTAFADKLAEVKLNSASLPIVSNLTAKLETGCYAEADYWLQHLRQPVQFQQSVDTLQQQGLDLLIEIGPKPVLTGLVRQNAENMPVIAACAGDNSIQAINQALADIVAGGLELDWQSLNSGRLTDLPTYPWQRQRYWPEWFTNQPVSVSDQHPLWGQWLSSSALPDNTEVFELKLTAANRSWLNQHRVYGLPVAPIALLIALIYEAMFKRNGHMDFAIIDLEIERALLIPEQDSITLQLILTDNDSVKILSQKSKTDTWLQHVSANLQQTGNTAQPFLSLADNAAPLSGQQYYQLFAEHGLQYGPSFQGIEQLWQQQNKAVAELNVPQINEQLEAPHPVLLDLAMQLMAAVFKPNSDGLRLPVRIGKIQCFRQDFADSHWIGGELNDAGQVDLSLFNSRKQLQFSISGVEVATVSESRLKQMLMPVSDWDYQLVWRPHVATANNTVRSWLLISDKENTSIADQLLSQGHQVRVLDFKQFAETDLTDVDEVVDLTALSVSTEPAQAMAVCAQLLELLQRLQGHNVRLTLVTRQAQGEFCRQLNYAGAALWGMATVLLQEHAELNPRIIDSNADRQLLTALLDSSGEQRLIATDQEIFAQRLQRYKSKSETQILIDSQASYLVTGGLGALGLATACWLIRQGARHLYLTSRQQNPRLPAELQALQHQHADLELVIFQTDITQAQAVEQLFADITQSGRPLKGIIHCAGFSDDDLLLNQSAQRLEQLNRVKLQAAALLDKASRPIPLDFFWLYSSLNALLGNIGQGAYAAANAAMDALAWQRNHEGFPALSINWGPWQNGMQQQSSDAMREFWQQSGLGLIDEERAGAVLDQLINRQNGQVCIVNFDWQKVSKSLSYSAAPGLLKELVPANNVAMAINTAEYLERLRMAEPEQIRELLADWVKQQLAQILKLPISQLELGSSLSSLGLDSLAAVEFRSLMRKTLQTEVPVSQLLQSDGWGLIDYLENSLSQSGQAIAEPINEDEDMLEGEL
ncbi:type I polyketide synthase [Methylobacter sp.]|uniref:type I polyketide synthase n=1 Tax=Methylobacter sp. TaxID=2051955 RepID=UPI0012267C41|nr:type I polyketide synthase [Methylobacter sp.]TAK60291.1 MAG: SDR family NAD(P)-dependent oxidoreductase [Methylobacter sp.]